MATNELLGHDAIVAEFLENSRDYLKEKSFYGDGAHDYMSKWEWYTATITAIAILNDTISRICLDKETYDA